MTAFAREMVSGGIGFQVGMSIMIFFNSLLSSFDNESRLGGFMFFFLIVPIGFVIHSVLILKKDTINKKEL